MKAKYPYGYGKRRKRPGACLKNPEGNPDLDWIDRGGGVYASPKNGPCMANMRNRETGEVELCMRTAFPNGKCGRHGGLSTGPRTEEGKRRSQRAVMKNLKYWPKDKDEAPSV